MAEIRLTTLEKNDARKLAVLINELLDGYSAVLAKLDLDAGVTDTDYASLHDVTDRIRTG